MARSWCATLVFGGIGLALLQVAAGRALADEGDQEEGCDPSVLAAARAAAAAECDCATATSHDAYVACVEQVAEADPNLSGDCQEIVIECADQSTCGRRNAVTCCRTRADGSTSCSIKPSARMCRASRGGTAT